MEMYFTPRGNRMPVHVRINGPTRLNMSTAHVPKTQYSKMRKNGEKTGHAVEGNIGGGEELFGGII